MSDYKIMFLKFYGYTKADTIPCAVCLKPANDIHHIQRRGMGGDKSLDRIDNLIPLCSEHHSQLGDRKQFKAMLYSLLIKQLTNQGFKDLNWIHNQITKYEKPAQ
jgi:hypothetical protein